MIFNELPIAFPWYDRLELQNRERENHKPICDFQLITPYNAMLPFQLTRPIFGRKPTTWAIYEANSQTAVATLDEIVATTLRPFNIGDLEYYTYDGRELTQGGNPIKLDEGWYYSRIGWDDQLFRYSELFYVPPPPSPGTLNQAARAFRIQDDDETGYLRFTWYNDADLDPLFYNDKRGDGTPYFRNVIYLDTFIVNSEPEITVDGPKDGNDTQISTFQKLDEKYRITIYCPDYLKKALVLMQLHDHCTILTQWGYRSGELNNPVVTSTIEGNGGTGTVDIVWTERTILKKGCADNMNSTPADLS